MQLHTQARERDVHAATHSGQEEGCTCSYTPGRGMYMQLHTSGRGMYLQSHTHARERDVHAATHSRQEKMYMPLHTHVREMDVHAATHSRQEECVQSYTQVKERGVQRCTSHGEGCTELHTHVGDWDVRSYTTRST